MGDKVSDKFNFTCGDTFKSASRKDSTRLIVR